MKGFGKRSGKRSDQAPAKPGREVKDFLEGFYQQSQFYIRNVVRTYADDPDMEEELFSETCLSLLAAGEKLRDMEIWQRQRYIVTTARNCAYGSLRRKKLERKYLVPWDDAAAEKLLARESAEDTALSREDALIIRDAVGRLPPRERDALVLKYWMDMDYRRIASVLGLSEDSVHTCTRRALEKLRGALFGKNDK